MNDYPNLRRVTYDFGESGMAVFVPVCPKCGRFVKAGMVFVTGSHVAGHNAVCKHCGPVEMPFEGWFGRGELKA